MKEVKNKSTAELALLEIKHLESKYESLIWFARKSKDDIRNSKEVKNQVEKVIQMYPEECAYLKSAYFGNWQHGFNSGILAAARLVQDLLCMSPEKAYENFPDLNT